MIQSNRCRVSEDELARDRAQRLDEKEGMSPATEQIVSERVEELMDADSEDEHSIIVLLESERFSKALSKVWSVRLDDDQVAELMTNPHFITHLRDAFGLRYEQKQCEYDLLAIGLDLNAWARNITGLELNSRMYPENYEHLKNLVSVAESVLSEYVELSL